MGKILVVEDDQDIQDLMRLQLERANHIVECASSGSEAKKLIQEKNFDLYILDWMLPEVSGLELCKEIRGQSWGEIVPIIMVTALSDEEHIILGLDSGADDYITKPFDNNVFQARVRAQLRRPQQQAHQSAEEEEGLFHFGQLSVSIPKALVTSEGSSIDLTHSEFKILTHLVKKPGHVFTRTQLHEKIQGPGVHVSQRTIDTHMAGLRKKLGPCGDYIETIRGIGYRFKDGEQI